MSRKISLTSFFKVTGSDVFAMLLFRIQRAIDVISLEILFREIAEPAIWAAEGKCFEIGDFEVIERF